jgi:hypothetical protein
VIKDSTVEREIYAVAKCGEAIAPVVATYDLRAKCPLPEA